LRTKTYPVRISARLGYGIEWPDYVDRSGPCYPTK